MERTIHRMKLLHLYGPQVFDQACLDPIKVGDIMSLVDTSHHITSHHITSYHVTSHHIISLLHHITSI